MTPEEVNGWIRDLAKHCAVDPDVLVHHALERYISEAQAKLRQYVQEQERCKALWRARKAVAQAALEEERNRIYVEPVSAEELDRSIDPDRAAALKRKYGPLYMPSFDIWLERLCHERGAACQICGQTDRARLTVHHRHRRTVGAETSRDLALVCRRCHKNYHVRYRQNFLVVADLPMVDRDNTYWFKTLLGSANLEWVIAEADRAQENGVDFRYALAELLPP
ncbi:HNH endonuclease signature motif containing protein [Caldilinea sp.]|uniref:HNH endonuclease signature motif containing protein n=1 Tax=Caldilinea sp. TaxID=2293560 RepID=UPI0021DD161B|nr:HNH endonuclease signature motif containing protein [Caldilinea sp.]GIV73513.1 MAG: hypothetical protein KatS3mg049_2069 [Caldilinea sp.]